MIKHIVMWRFQDYAEGNDKASNIALVKSKLEALTGIIPELLTLEVGEDFSCGDASGELALYSEFASRETLQAYQQHPEHVAVVQFIMRVVSERRVVDYEI